MIDAVLLFGALNVLFEFVVLSMVPPRMRLRVLGDRNKQALIHVGVLLVNLIIHWGTLIGTMSGILSFVCSIVTVRIAQLVFGQIKDGRYYTVGLVKYSREELK